MYYQLLGGNYVQHNRWVKQNSKLMSVGTGVYDMTATTTTTKTTIKSVGKNLKHPNHSADTCVRYKRRSRREIKNEKAK